MIIKNIFSAAVVGIFLFAQKNFCDKIVVEVIKMSELRNDSIRLISTAPEKYLAEIFETVKNLISRKNNEEEDKKLEMWQAEPEKYENELNEWVCNFVKESRRKSRSLENADNN